MIMNIQSLLRGEFLCTCGQKHNCDIHNVVVEKNAVAKIPSLLDGYKHVLVVSDGNTRRVCGENVVNTLKAAGFDVTEAFFNQTELVIPDEEAVAFIESFITADTQVIIGIGGGVMNDLSKYVSFFKKLPYMIVGTAPSMDGFASKGAAMVLKGMKETVTCHVPTWIVSDVDVLAQAPMKMIRAGIGDILGKYSCLNDWKLATIINGEHFCQYIYDLVSGEVAACRGNIDACMARDASAIGRLMESLVIVGIAMAYLGNSRPASGAEHHFSHFFEITGIVFGRPYMDHGVDVAYSTILTAKMRRMMAAEDPATFTQTFDRAAWENNIPRVYGKISNEVMALMDRMKFYTDDRLSVIKAKWPEIKAALEEAPDEKEIEALLVSAGYDKAGEFIPTYGEALIRDAMEFAKDLKDRYTLLWLLENTGKLHEYARTMTI